jgi:hypothetical protein
MKIRTILRAIEFRLLAVVLLATCAFAAAANAQSVTARFTLRSETHWGKKVLPPGNYTFSFDSHTNVAFIQSADGKTSGYTPIPVKEISNTGASALFVMVRGNERMVRSLNLPAYGVSLTYIPQTSAEREMLAKADQVQAVPVIIAGN